MTNMTAVLRDLITSISEGTPEGELFKAGYSIRPPPNIITLDSHQIYKIEYTFQYIHQKVSSPREMSTMVGYLEKKGTDLEGTCKGVWKK
jgi:hypothetical protein